MNLAPIAPLDMNGIQVEEEKKEERPINANIAVNMGGWQMPEHMVANIPPDDI